MQFQGGGKPSVGIVFDAGLGNTIEDVLALASLYGFQSKNESRVISVSTTRSSLNAAVFADILMRFFTGAPEGFGVGPTPIGLTLGPKSVPDTPMMAAVVGKMADGKPAYTRGIEKMNDTADPLATIRNAISAQYAQNAIVLLTGPATNLAKLLDLPGAKALIVDKVRYLVVAAGNYPTGAADPRILTDLPAARRLFAEWPTNIVAAGSDLGSVAPFPASSLEKDFSWAPNHPVVDAYRAFRPMPYDAPSAALAAALYAVHPADNFFRVSEPGTISVLDDGRTKFTPAAEGKHKYLIADPTQKDKITQLYVETASTKPVPRTQRFRPGAKKQDDAKKQEEKKQ